MLHFNDIKNNDMKIKYKTIKIHLLNAVFIWIISVGSFKCQQQGSTPIIDFYQTDGDA